METTTMDQWYILRGEEKFGPFEYGAMIRLMQTSEVTDSNYVWAPHLEQWTAMGELAEFSRDRLARLVERGELQDAFNRRASPRAAAEIPLFGHNGEIFFDGKTLSVSQHGALALLNSPLLLPGQVIQLHLRRSAGPGAPSLDGPLLMKAEVLRKNFSRRRLNVKSGLHYALRFVEATPDQIQRLKDLVNQKAKEA